MCELLYDVAGAASSGSCCVCFVGVDVHSKSKAFANANNGVAEDGGSAFGFDLNRNDFLIGYAEFSSVCGSHVDVSLCYDNAVGEFNRSAVCGVNELYAGRACSVAAFTNGSGNAKGSCVGEGYFNLACLTSGTEDANAGDGLLGANNVKTFSASELTGLGKVFLVGELIAFTKENVDMFLRQVDMTCRSFNDKSCHFLIPLSTA